MSSFAKSSQHPIDGFIIEFDRALRSIVGATPMRRPVPDASTMNETELSAEEKKHAAGLMRVNHVGEVCAQALYQSQKLHAKSDDLKNKLEHAAIEEEDHLAWCERRLEELDSRPSLLNPVWYAGSFVLGSIAGLAGDKISLGFVAETEKQVEHHLDEHLKELPSNDHRSRAIVAQMRADEIAHGQMAIQEGGVELPSAVQKVMKTMAKVMTVTAYRV
ncbi:2-polyprenyl-3-methyl-6-methoxy-1,4-benzoquinone monooxygenase [Polynucleobacter sp. AM-26B4]|jgi:ubiquinone biosynthesis monooxygenase Coq7|uniref:2-polyprenyl-3-methyl-6-methoxy-1,4-benzoquinone monooxygenase n=1 Tax=Polynucleobacter sp. AM-26B4 TaxID=2689103 RepID=UPI001C0CE75D|nr:2-polyprenyl-3-methyl-6-methoxy-1,4-benzoquinone monooxygenase [Polynucleobacter sp. AM-26B4]MBU3585246.1 2-polyprenyl-3-methyl-6-methoxy-1,4-benzoquinone monooxygenase [Polynucleobacter sp. AM-26B4]